MQEINVGQIKLGNHLPLAIIGGLNVLESRDLALRAAEHFVSVTEKLELPYIFKASFDKANRTSIHSFRGPGLEEGLKILQEVKQSYSVPVITDVHEIPQAVPVAEVCDILQVPAFLARQTDLIRAVAETGAVINVKKPQFMSPTQIGNIVGKLKECGNEQVLLCERGSCYGHDNLVVDMLGFQVMKDVSDNAPIIFDVTHSLQMREVGAEASGGRRSQIVGLGRAGVAAGIAGLFVEAHPDPDKALCDGPSALPFDKLFEFLGQMKAVDDVVKKLPAIDLDEKSNWNSVTMGSYSKL